MKKITLSLSALLISFAGISKSFQVTTTIGPSEINRNPSAILWHQPSIGGNEIISDYSSADFIGVYSTDDFELTTANTISTISVYGFQNDQNITSLLTGFDLYIYGNSANDVPMSYPTILGAGLLEIVDLDPNGGALTIVEDG